MTVDELKNSGDLEAYVCGVLTREQSREISKQVKKSDELQNEVQNIEDAYFKLAAGISPSIDEVKIYENLRNYIKETEHGSDSSNWSQYLGWAAAILLFIGAGYFFHENTNLNEQLVDTERTNDILNTELDQLDDLNADYQEALAFIKDKNTIKVNLAGQGDFASSSAVAFHNPISDKTYVDVSGLPEAPENMTYQLWSLTLNPLSPTDLGVVSINEQKFVEFDNSFETQAFGITLENAGGSESPTLEKLYTLGVIE
ncbi:Anti-sigma-K factor rskA [Nonlabens sp. Hel1_33_55]|uniref:anti-sigma factor n=1 Tax=Nonlabens sp. Hel1_33_55 TaxID=1336802 RepID=UPI000875D40C|nr:anti-sigma factor [Nonlabens sp. Hel1_33_55]SCY09363.1 Anti-sigma-K factor rskA [Nonlabens sp. Hel1_33_55]